MNNFKKIGLSALAGSMAVTSAQAFDASVSVESQAVYSTAQGNEPGASEASNGKGIGVDTDIAFSGSGELDNGLNVSLSFVIDQGDDASNADGTTKSSNAGTPFDSHSVTVSSDGLGTLVFSGEGGSSAQSAIDTTAAGDAWDAYYFVHFTAFAAP